MTETFFIVVMFAILGFISGRVVKGLNPLMMLAGGAVVIAPTAMALVTLQNPFYTALYAIGFIFYFGNPLRKVFGSFEEFTLSSMLNKAQVRRASERLAQEKQIIEEELRRQKAQAEEELARRQREAQDHFRRESERFNQEREQFRRDMAERASDLNPKNYDDACEILGCEPGATTAELKSAYKTLANIYHPDKVARLTGKRKKQMEEEFKIIQQAWETVKR